MTLIGVDADMIGSRHKTHPSLWAPCSKCGGTERYEASGACKPCFREKFNADRRARPAYHKARDIKYRTSTKGVRTRRDDFLRRRYGITLEQFETLLVKQEGRCAACGELPIGTGQHGLHLDHDHSTKRVRGLLCRPCNLALGLLKDKRERIEGLLAYLGRQ